MKGKTGAGTCAAGRPGRVPWTCSKPRRHVRASCVSSKDAAGTVSASDTVPTQAPPSPNGGPQTPNGASSDSGNGNGAPTLVAPSRPRRPVAREEPEPEATPTEPSGPSESALMAALAEKDRSRKLQKAGPPTRKKQAPVATPRSPTSSANGIQAPRVPRTDRAPSVPASNVTTQQTDDSNIELPMASKEVLLASVAPPKAPTRIVTPKDVSTKDMSVPLAASVSAPPADPKPTVSAASSPPVTPTPSAPVVETPTVTPTPRPPPAAAPSPPSRPVSSKTTAVPSTRTEAPISMPAVPQRPSAVAAAAADPTYNPVQPTDSPGDDGVDLSLSEEIIVEPRVPESAAPPAPLPANETLAAPPSAPRKAAPSTNFNVPQRQRGPDGSPAPVAPTMPTEPTASVAPAANVLSQPTPTMLSAPVRAPPPAKPAAPPSTGGQDDRGNNNQGGGDRNGGGGRGRMGTPASRQNQGRGRTRVDTQRRGDDRRPGGGRGAGGRGGGRGGDRRGNTRGGQWGSLTAENRRKARKEKKEMLAARRQGTQRDKEEIFEVPPEGLNVGELADLLAVNAAEVVKALFMKGVMAQVNQQLDIETVRLAAAAFGAEAVEAGEAAAEAGAKKDEFMTEEDLEFLVPRPPVVCVMGHVDHGKTSLLDRIREASVAEGEAGGITQAIGAYNVRVEGSTVEEVCFLDTPGHEAFSAMRARGAKVTDIAIIIVAADDGVRPQTLEAIAHAQAAEVPIVVAINKIDKPGADIERVRGELAGEANLVPEEWGGTVPFVSISAKKGLGIEELLETVALVAEVEELQANPERAAVGTVLEAHLNRQVGPVATLLVQAGTLRKGDMVQAGASCGRVRRCSDSMGEEVDEALPSTAVSVIGLDAVPAAGDVFTVFENESDANEAAEEAKEKERKARMAEMSSGSAVTLSTLATVDDEQEALQRMNLIVKADASGTLEAVKAALQGLPQDSVALRFLLASTGPVQPSDVELARSSEALVIGFNTDISDDAEARAKSLGVEVKTFDVIYALLDDVRGRMEGRLKAVTEKVPCGKAEVKALFGKGKSIYGGCIVTEGKLVANGVIEVRRNRKVVFEGDLSSLRRFKDEVGVVEEGVECGVGCKDFWQWEEGDKITCFELVQKTLTLEESSADRAVDGDFDEVLLEAQAEYAAEEARRQKEEAWRNQ